MQVTINLLTTRQFADRLQIGLSTAKRWLANGTVRYSKICGAVRIPESEIERLFAAGEQKGRTWR